MSLRKRQRIVSAGRLTSVDGTLTEVGFDDADVVLRLELDVDVDPVSLDLHLRSAALRRSRYFAALLSDRWQIPSEPVDDDGGIRHHLTFKVLPPAGGVHSRNPSGPFDAHVTVLRLLHTLDFSGAIGSVSDALELIPVASELLFDDCVQACVRFLEAIPWTEEEEEEVLNLIPFLRQEEAQDLLARVSPTVAEQWEGKSAPEEMLHGLIDSAIRSHPNVATVKAFVAKLLRDYSSRDLVRRALDQAFLASMETVKDHLPALMFHLSTRRRSIGTRAGIFSGVTLALYPLSLIKTRMQVASKDAVQKNAFSAFRNILKVDGVPGLYRGFGTVITGAIPARIVFLTSLETTKVASLKLVEPFKLSEPVQAAIANGIAGMSASLCSQAVFVPVDVVSQKLMVQGYSGFAKYNGGFDAARQIIKSDGIRGLYRGFGLSVVTYSPSSAVWWASYGASQHIIWKLLGHGNHDTSIPSQWKVASVQATGGVVAGAMTSCITTPLDTIKTRLQVIDNMEEKQNIRQVIKTLIAEDGWKGFYRGLGPRFFTMSAWGTTMIVAYEYLKRICLISEEI